LPSCVCCVFLRGTSYLRLCFDYSLPMPDDNSLVTMRNACRLRSDLKILEAPRFAQGRPQIHRSFDSGYSTFILEAFGVLVPSFLDTTTTSFGFDHHGSKTTKSTTIITTKLRAVLGSGGLTLSLAHGERWPLLRQQQHMPGALNGTKDGDLAMPCWAKLRGRAVVGCSRLAWLRPFAVTDNKKAHQV
jgi:hypothetical protein